jgi:DNA-directed RNA polymerase subunit M
LRRDEEALKRLLDHYERRWRPKTGDPFRSLVRTILSQNTNYKNEATAYQRLEDVVGVTPEILADTPAEVIADAIRPAGMYNHRYKCPRCGAAEPMEVEAVYVNNRSPKNDKIIVIGKNERKMRTAPQTNALCTKCGNDRAYWWMVQTRSADESSTQFFRCTRCRRTWREYS